MRLSSCLPQRHSSPTVFLRARLTWLHIAWLFVLLTLISPVRGNELTEESEAKPAGASLEKRPPNIIVILADDLGYGDLGCYGNDNIATPNIDRLANQGTRFTDFYVSQAVCSASRASLMTGCYANRVGLEGALNHTSPTGISSTELLLPELLKSHGYATAILGKWHLGLPPHFNPLNHGFDHWWGIPYSNDNSKYHPTLAPEMPPLPLFIDRQVSETDPDQSLFTRNITDEAKRFIKSNNARPFFLYLAHVMPHVPIFASKPFDGRTGKGRYADVVTELDAAVGELMQTLKDAGIEDNTWVIFSSDNGPFLSYGEHAGKAGPLREGKLTCFEGGVRVPCIMRWPNQILADHVSDVPWMTIDLLPTIQRLLGDQEASANRPGPIDGLDATEVILGKSREPPHQALAFYSGSELHAVRSGKWKLHVPHPYLTVDGDPGVAGKPAGYGRLQPQSIQLSGVKGIASRHGYRVEDLPLSLYDLEQDVGEQSNVAAAHPEVVGELMRYVEQFRLELGDSLTNQQGAGVRPAGRSP